MKPRRALVTACAVALAASNAAGYQILTHFDLSKASAQLAISDDQLESLGLRSLASGQTFPAGIGSAHSDFVGARTTPPSSDGCAHNALYSAIDLIACGAMFEDVPGTRSFNHFFDPQHLVAGRPRSLTLLLPILPTHWNSADWALRDDPSNSPDQDTQPYAYKGARNYFYDALTKTGSEQIRKVQWGLMFQSLGQVIHHIQDMAQPQHTRNDPHLDLFEGRDLPPITNVSRYETRAVENRDVGALIRQYAAGAAAVYPAYATMFPTPRSFWSNNGAGMAEYSSLNFVSQGTNFRMEGGVARANVNFVAPAPADVLELTMADLVNDPTFLPTPASPFVLSQCGANLTGCKVTMYKTVGQDALTGASLVNNYASTYSVFDQDLAAYGRNIQRPNPDTGQFYTTERDFAINRYNIDAAYKFLIPKAAGYSAGLINYFFRGQMEIRLPDAGVYAILDHSVESCADACGFRKIKLKVKNTTANEAMTAGVFRVVAKYHRNTCYQVDLSGDPGADGCRTTGDEVTVSAAGTVANAALTSLNFNQELETTFIFGSPIPINARDLFLQVVFQGQLGAEAGAVAVATKKISEPSFVTAENDTDYVFVDGNCYKPEVVAANDALWNRLAPFCKDTHTRRVSDFCANVPFNLRFTAGPTANRLVVAMEQGGTDQRVRPRHFARFAVLSDVSAPFTMLLTFNNPPLIPLSGDIDFTPYRLQEDPIIVDRYLNRRGINLWEGLVFIVDATGQGVGANCPAEQFDALSPGNGETAPLPLTITGW
jgi:hypothetical protein